MGNKISIYDPFGDEDKWMIFSGINHLNTSIKKSSAVHIKHFLKLTFFGTVDMVEQLGSIEGMLYRTMKKSETTDMF